MIRIDDVKYRYSSLSVPGGGFVTGFVFHPRERGLMYARTDIGGIYRFDFQNRRWIFCGEWLTEFTHHLSQPLALALDPHRPERLFAMCGNCWREGMGSASLLVSEDYGRSFREKKVTFPCNGNAPARSTAERLALIGGRLFFGSQGAGLWVSDNEGDSWTKADFPEENIVFLHADEQGRFLLVSCTGETRSDGNTRGDTLYISYDLRSFSPVTVPDPLDDPRCSYNGFVPCAVSSHGERVLISFSHSFRDSFAKWNSFACDNGGGFDGRLLCYEIHGDKLCFSRDITPDIGFSDENPRRRLPFGMGGVDFIGETIALCSAGGHGDAVFISRDGGASYALITSADLGRFKVDVPYLKPEYNGGRIPLHWMSCLKLDPFDPDFAVFNTGTGAFALNALTSDEPYISTLCYGMEETVHMNIYGVPSGKNNVIDLVGDLGGFAFRVLDRPCENSFADKDGHRYITCLNADFMQDSPDTFIATARGNWTGHTKGGVILTTDGGDSFTHIGYPRGISDRLDGMIDGIMRPNTNSGWAAISADGEVILWTLAHNWAQIPCFGAVRYEVRSGSFSKIKVYDINSCDISDSERCIKIFSDRIDSGCFYGFGEEGQVYLSSDGGRSFKEVECGLPHCCMSGIDGRKGVEIRFLPHTKGECLLALANEGLWRLRISSDGAHAEQITDSFVKTVGFGKGDSNAPAFFISGVLFGEYGFWRSFDNGKSWARINTDAQMYGHIVSMDGDMSTRGRVYIATGCHGGLYGEEI